MTNAQRGARQVLAPAQLAGTGSHSALKRAASGRDDRWASNGSQDGDWQNTLSAPMRGFCAKFSSVRGKECKKDGREITDVLAGQSRGSFDSQSASFFCRKKRGCRSRRCRPAAGWVRDEAWTGRCPCRPARPPVRGSGARMVSWAPVGLGGETDAYLFCRGSGC